MGTWAISLAVVAIGGLQEGAPEAIAGRLNTPVLEDGRARAELESYVLSRLPALEVPEDPETWREESARLRRQVLDQAMLRGVPEAWVSGPVSVEWLETIDQEGYSVRKLRYEAVPGLWIPALLYVPDEVAGKTPAVLNVNGHVGEPGKAVDYKQIRCINLAKRGVLALNPEWYRMGELDGTIYGHDRIAYLDLAGVSGVSLFYLAMKRGLDVLESQPQTDPERIAVTGLSGGGWQTIVISSLDTRVKLAAPNAGYIGTPTRIRFPGDVGDLEQVPTDMIGIADYTHLTAMRAPLPTLLIYNASDECCFPAYRAKDSVYDPIIPFYELFGAVDRFGYHENIDPGTHNYELDNRQQFYAFLNDHFGLDTPDEELPTDGEVLTRAELDCGVPEGNESIISIATALADPLPVTRMPARDSSGYDEWAAATRVALREVLKLPAIAPAAQSAKIETQTAAGIALASYKLRVGEWTLPAVSLHRQDTASEEVVVLVSDEGKATLGDLVGPLLEEGKTVVLFDPLYAGELTFDGDNNWQSCMFIQSAGGRVMGLQAQQLAAVCTWARNAFHAKSVRLQAKGRLLSTAALAMQALYPASAEAVQAPDVLPSLKDLIHEDAGYSRNAPLYCFGLLRVVDMNELKALAGQL